VLRLLYLAARISRPRDCPVQPVRCQWFAVGARSLGRRGLCAVHALSGSTLDGVLPRRRVSGAVGQATRTDRLCAVPETRVTRAVVHQPEAGTAAPGADLPPPFPAEAGGHARPVSRSLCPLLHVFSSRSLRGLGPCLAGAAGWLTCAKPGSGVAAAAIFSSILHGAYTAYRRTVEA